MPCALNSFLDAETMGKMKKAVLYIHGKGGTAQEAEHYAPLFPGCDVIGLAYSAQTPWEAKEELSQLFDGCGDYDTVAIIGNSIGAYYAMTALSEKNIELAFFVSPIVDMERLICDMMQWADVTEAELAEKKEISTSFGETLSWEYLGYVREHPIVWNIPTHILYGEKDSFTSYETILRFAERTHSSLTVLQNGEHWFHTREEMEFLDAWIEKMNKA